MTTVVSLLGDDIIRALFQDEAGELLGQIDEGLPRLREDGVARSLARAAHTLKGSSGVVGLIEVHQLAAALEASLEAIDAGAAPLDDLSAAAVAGAARDLRGLIDGSVDDARRSLELLTGEAPVADAGEVLVVDDSPTLRAAHERMLRAGGFTVRTAEHGRAALALLGESAPGLVVTDLEMPVMDGFRLIEAIRTLPSRGDVPILVVSSNEGDDVRRRCMALGAQAYVAKHDLDEVRLVFEADRLVRRS
jgi:two-component system chemotaxis response regulator CheY